MGPALPYPEILAPNLAWLRNNENRPTENVG